MSYGRRLLAFGTAAGILVMACAGDGTGLEEGNGGGGTSFSGDVQPIFTANCALSGCHAAPSPQENQNLTAGQAYANIVNVSSMQLPTMNRVTPGEPDSSYLVHKIQGTQVFVGGSGQRMPFGGNRLPQSQINTIRNWIQEGALNN